MNLDVAKLTLEVSPQALKRDLDALEGEVRTPQPGTDHDGSWRGIALVQQGGDGEFAGTLKHGSKTLRPSPTQLLDKTPHFRAIIESLGTIHRARVSELPAGSVIEEHRDPSMSLHERVCRIHVPVVTHEDVDFRVNGRRVHFLEGEVWYADFTQPHSVTNGGAVNRVHLVIDVVATETLLDKFPPAYLSAVERRHGPIHLAPLRNRPLTEPLVEGRFGARFSLPDALIAIYEGRRGSVKLDADAGHYRLHVDGVPGRFLYVVDEDTLELEDGRLVLRYAFEAGRPIRITAYHYRLEDPLAIDVAEPEPSRPFARVEFDDRRVILPVVDESEWGATFAEADLGPIRVHDRVSVAFMDGPGAAQMPPLCGEVRWRDLSNDLGLFGVLFDRG